MMLERLRHICFDKDGTITDVHVYWTDIIHKRVRKLSGRYALSAEHEGVLTSAMGIDLKQKRIIPPGPVGYKPRNVVVEAARGVLEYIGVKASAEDIDQIFASVDQEMQEKNSYCLRLLENVPESFRALYGLGLKISVYTSDRIQNLRNIVQKLELEEYICALVGGDEVQRPKPDADGFRMACDRSGIPLEHSVYVGDTLDDMMMANRCGSLGGIGVTTGLCSREQLLTQTELVFDDLRLMSRYLKSSRDIHV